MSSEDNFKLLCIPEDGVPFEAMGHTHIAHRICREENRKRDKFFIDLVRWEFGDDVIPSPPFYINPQLKIYNKVWDGV